MVAANASGVVPGTKLATVRPTLPCTNVLRERPDLDMISSLRMIFIGIPVSPPGVPPRQRGAALDRRSLAYRKNTGVVVLRGLVAFEARRQFNILIWLLFRCECAIFPFAVAQRVRVFAAPARALLHHRVAQKLAFNELPLRPFHGLAPSSCAAHRTTVNTVALGIGRSLRAAANASGIA